MGFLLVEGLQLCLVLIEGYMSSLYTPTSPPLPLECTKATANTILPILC
jgi:hypothetical protein